LGAILDRKRSRGQVRGRAGEWAINPLILIVIIARERGLSWAESGPQPKSSTKILIRKVQGLLERIDDAS
jgi:hypothetical protein